MLVPLLVLKTC